jgi:hypothetical protein
MQVRIIRNNNLRLIPKSDLLSEDAGGIANRRSALPRPGDWPQE